jgi:hypothetical protein
MSSRGRLSSVCFAGKALISGANEILAVAAFETPNSKMSARDCLKVLDKRIIDRAPAESTNHGYRLGGRLLCNDHPKPRADLGDQPHQHRGAFLDYAALRNEPGSLSNRSREHTARNKISCFRGVIGL